MNKDEIVKFIIRVIKLLMLWLIPMFCFCFEKSKNYDVIQFISIFCFGIVYDLTRNWGEK